MFRLTASKNQIVVQETEPMTSGSVNVYQILFEFSSDWDGFDRFAVFDDGDARIEIQLDDTNICDIPWQVMTDPGDLVEAGVYGVKGQQVLPTIWAVLGEIQEGVLEGDLPEPPPEMWESALQSLRESKADNMTYENDILQLRAGEKVLSSATITGGSGGPGSQGPPGADGKSAYEIAVEGGFVGSEEEWLTSLKGEPGPDGSNGATFTPAVSEEGMLSWTNDSDLLNPEPVNIKGQQGEPGQNGKNAYQIAVENGFEGTEEEWLESLKGESGIVGEISAADVTYVPEIGPKTTVKVTLDTIATAFANVYQELNDRHNVYSTEEIVIGKWIDGRPIYRITYITTTPSNGDNGVVVVPFNRPEIEMVNYYGQILSVDASNKKYWLPINYFNGGSTHCYTQIRTDVGIQMTMGQVATRNRSCWITLEYVKTTDGASMVLDEEIREIFTLPSTAASSNT